MKALHDDNSLNQKGWYMMWLQLGEKEDCITAPPKKTEHEIIGTCDYLMIRVYIH
jgi:hypothetical protein